MPRTPRTSFNRNRYLDDAHGAEENPLRNRKEPRYERAYIFGPVHDKVGADELVEAGQEHYRSVAEPEQVPRKHHPLVAFHMIKTVN